MVKIAAVQAAPVWNDARGTLDKCIGLIQEAGSQGVRLLGFGETFLPGYPYGIWLHAPMKAMEQVMTHRGNAITVDGPEMKAIGEAARKAGTWVMLGYAERDLGSIYCAQALIDDHGEVVMNRRKLRPTHMERTIWGEGRLEGFAVVDAPFGRVGGLNCWEHLQPLNRQGMFQLGEQIHVASWPGFGLYKDIPGTHAMSGEASLGESSSYALQGGCFVLVGCSIIREEDRLPICMGDESLLPCVSAGGGVATVFGPDGSRLTEPLDEYQDGLAIADVDLTAIEAAKMFADPAGHYFRPDVARYVLEGVATPARAVARKEAALADDAE